MAAPPPKAAPPQPVLPRPSPPINKTQRAADALLDGPTFASKLRRASVNNNIYNNNNNNNNNDNNNNNCKNKKHANHSDSASSLLLANRNGRTVSNSAVHNPHAPKQSTRPKQQGGGAAHGKKRPLVRGNNAGRPSPSLSSRNASVSSRAATASARKPAAAGAVAFGRRHSRDRVSRREAPPTATDRTLVALLDGPSAVGKNKKAMVIHGRERHGETKRRKTTPNAAAAANAPADPDAVLAVAPPPMPSYHFGTQRPKKAGSSSHSNGRGLMMATHELPRLRKRGSSHTLYSKKESRNRLAAAAAGGAANAAGERKENDQNGNRLQQPPRTGEVDDALAAEFSGREKKENSARRRCRQEGDAFAHAASSRDRARTGEVVGRGSGSTGGNARDDAVVAKGVADGEYTNPDYGAVQEKAADGRGRTESAAAMTAAATLAAGGDGGGGPKRTAVAHNPYKRRPEAKGGCPGDTPAMHPEAARGRPQGATTEKTPVSTNAVPTAAATIRPNAAYLVDRAAYHKIRHLTATDAYLKGAAMPHADDVELLTLAPMGIGGGANNKRGANSKRRRRGDHKNDCRTGLLPGGSSSGSGSSSADGRGVAKESPSEAEGVSQSREEGAKKLVDVPTEGTDRDSVPSEAYDDNGDEGDAQDKANTVRAEWYDPEEDAILQKEIAARNNGTADGGSKRPKGGRRSKSGSGSVNDNFVRLDLRNSAGSCRGARNLKRANKQKLWRATHMFGMSERDSAAGGGNAGKNVGDNGGGDSVVNDEGGRDNGDMGMGSICGSGRYGGKYSKRRGSSNNGGGDLKCFAAKHGGVDPLDDFVDGVFSASVSDGDGNNKGQNKSCTTMAKTEVGGGKRQRQKATTAASQLQPPARDGGMPLCTRHQRPCKLLVVKRNHKGNKGRKFYVCCMPRGEQCDFFKWEEDTVEATQRALLSSSSSSGFIARQVSAAKARFKDLTLPELRVEAKKRGLKSTGKKDQILTRVLIWVRDEIADSVTEEGREEPNDTLDRKNKGTVEEEEVRITVPDDTAKVKDVKDVHAELKSKEVEEVDIEEINSNDNEGCRSDPHMKCKDTEMISDVDAADTTRFIELSNDDESSYSDDDDGASNSDESSSDELEICSKPSTKQRTSNTNNSESSALHAALTKYFGHTDFRPGQEWAISRTLSHAKSLLVAPTGQGKSLCYALPAALLPGLCVVVSPLISLMQDQLRQLPPKIPAATLSGSVTTAQMALIVDDILRGRYKVLFVSPERLASAAFRRLVRPHFNIKTGQHERRFPEVSLLCVDEAHCISQWAHTFRPSYLRVRSLLPLIEPKSILALTATAGPMVIRDICNTLRIPFDGCCPGSTGHVNLPFPAPQPIEASNINPNGRDNASSSDGVKILNCDRDNIDVFSLVLESNDERRYLLHKILKEKSQDKSGRSKKLPLDPGCLSKGSVIVYVWRQKDTEIVAEQIFGAGIRGGVVCYHGGMDAESRRRAQSKFMRGKARICVATVAFGLGIDKPDIEGVIHLCMPPSPEHYLQEIGRAGRDGRAAKAIALPLTDEFISRNSLAHSDRVSINQLEIVFLALQHVVNEALSDIPPEAGIDLDAERLFIDDLHVAIPVMKTVDASDWKEGSIETVFSLLEESNNPSGLSLLSVEGYLPDAATITLKRRSLDKLAKLDPVALSISKCSSQLDCQNERSNTFGGTAMEKGFYAYSFGTYKFSVVRCARCMGPNMEPRHVYAALRRLQGSGELELVLDTTDKGRAMHLRMTQDGINLFRKKGSSGSDQVPQEMEVNDSVMAVVAKLAEQFSAKEKVGVGKCVTMYNILYQVSMVTDEDEEDVNDEENTEAKKSPRLILFQKLIQMYFLDGSITGETVSSCEEQALPLSAKASKDISNVIKDFPLRNGRLLTCLSADISLLMQVLLQRRQEQIPMAVCIKESRFADYRDLCLAKILHSIDAPRAPILEWYNHVLWGKYRSYSFSSVAQAVKSIFDNAQASA